MKTNKSVFAIAGMLNYIIVVFLNAFTDLGHKIIVQNTVFKVYDGEVQIMLTAIVNALVLFPYILVFSPSGFLADRFAKSKVMQYSALAAVVLTSLITFAYYQGWFFFAFTMTFLLALQSAIFAPAKYGYLKELVGEKYISSGNAAVQGATTVAILGGIITYTILFESRFNDSLKTESDILQAIAPLGWFLILGSSVEFLLAWLVPNTQTQESKRRFNYPKYFKGIYLYRNIKTITRKKEIFDAILALSFFWAISQVILAIFGEYAKTEIGITNTIFVQGVMALAGVGIVFGSVLAARLSRDSINLGLPAIGALFITIIVFTVPFIHSMIVIAALFTLFGVFSAFLLVPLNARVQYLAPHVHLGTILAASNFVQNIFMFLFLIVTTVFAYFGMNAEILFYVMGFVGIYLFYVLLSHYFPEFFWNVMKFLLMFRYKITYIGRENLQADKAILLLGNHVSWLDWAILHLGMKRRINYMMDKDIYQNRFFNPVLKQGEVIPLSPKAFKDAMREASQRLKNKKVVAIFPEGGISYTENLAPFQRGFELIDKKYEGYIVPFFIDGMFGSIFARYKGKNQHKALFSRRNVYVYFGEPLLKESSVQIVEERVNQLKEKNGLK